MHSAEKRLAGDCYVSPQDLKEKQIYLMISFFDDELRIPDITTVVYLGKDIFREGDRKHYFQEYSAFTNSSPGTTTSMIEAEEDQLMNFFDLHGASRLLAHCGAEQGKKAE